MARASYRLQKYKFPHLHFLLNDKKGVKIFGLKTWRAKEFFGYRVVHDLDTA